MKNIDCTTESYNLFDTGLCPNCGSDKNFVEKTVKPVRKKYCDDCGAEWSTITVNLWDPDSLSKAAEIERQKAQLAEKFPFL